MSSHISDTTSLDAGEWCNRSQVALDSVTKIVIDIVAFHRGLISPAPSYQYIGRAALRHIHGTPNWRDEANLCNAENQLRVSLEPYKHEGNIRAHSSPEMVG